MQIKTAMWYTPPPPIEKQNYAFVFQQPSVGKAVEQPAGGNVNWYNPCGQPEAFTGA